MTNKLGILLTQLGTPEAPTPKAVRHFLAEFLTDPRVIELPPLLWRPILHGLVLRLRPRKSAHAYQQIWTVEGSPLLSISKQQIASLQKLYANQNVKIALGMRYGKPSIQTGLEELRNFGADRIIIFPLYPQYCASTTASTFDAVAKVLKSWRVIPEVRMINHYYNHPDYIQALAASVQQHWQAHGTPQHLLFSFHGIPAAAAAAGDPYPLQCRTTAALVAKQLDLSQQTWSVAFQSRFGFAGWLEPYTQQILQQLPKQGITNLNVICPGFSADCLETLEEINIRGKQDFLQAGGINFSYIPALNYLPAHIHALKNIIDANSWESN